MNKLLRAFLNLPGTLIFPISQKSVKIIELPRDFHQSLSDGISRSRYRITLASLYINENEQRQIIASLGRALKSKPLLRVHILLDYLRGTRGDSNSLTLFKELIQQHPDRIRFSLYHTPNLKGLAKRILPPRFNEVIGLQHMKAYIFDNDIILSGANLSTEYYENRQDRYIEFKDSKNLSDYYDTVIEQVASISYQYLDSSLLSPQNIKKTEFKENLENATRKYESLSTSLNGLDGDDPLYDTYVIPKLQMGAYGINDDRKMLTHIIKYISAQSTRSCWTLNICSGYLNFPQYLQRLILSTPLKFSILTSAPEANGFFRSKGLSRFIPDAYTYLEKRFLNRVKAMERDDIHVHEYCRPGWTWHGKGIWIYSNNQSEPLVTVIGSSNYGKRSENRDLECQCYLLTVNDDLKSRIQENLVFLYQHSKNVSIEDLKKPERQVSTFVALATRLIKSML